MFRARFEPFSNRFHAACSGPGVGLGVGLHEAFGADVGVNLGGGEAGVAEQFLDAAQVGTGVEQVRGEGVAQLVRRAVGRQPRLAQERLERALHGTRCEPAASLVLKQRAPGEGGQT